VAGSFVGKGKSLCVTLVEGSVSVITRAPVGSIDSNKELQVRRPGTAYRWEFDFASPWLFHIAKERLKKLAGGIQRGRWFVPNKGSYQRIGTKIIFALIEFVVVEGL
jgi:hypothetical protein